MLAVKGDEGLNCGGDLGKGVERISGDDLLNCLCHLLLRNVAVMRDVCAHVDVSGGGQHQDDIKLATSLVGKE